MAKNCPLKQKRSLLPLKKVRYARNTKVKSDYGKVHFCSEEDAYQEFRSAPKLLLLLEEEGHQDIKTSRHQDIKTSRHQE